VTNAPSFGAMVLSTAINLYMLASDWMDSANYATQGRMPYGCEAGFCATFAVELLVPLEGITSLKRQFWISGKPPSSRDFQT
jgi:hypothetical protein